MRGKDGEISRLEPPCGVGCLGTRRRRPWHQPPNDQDKKAGSGEAGGKKKHRRNGVSRGVLDPRHDILGNEAAKIADGIDRGKASSGAGTLEKPGRKAPEHRLSGKYPGSGNA
jgi:hypothetical protein